MNTTDERLQMHRACPYCRSVPATNNPSLCTCLFDCGRDECGRVGSGEPEYRGSDVNRLMRSVITAEDHDPEVQKYRAELRRRIADDAKG